jgi:putative addiction module component (TIGR02574 family)
LNAFTNLACLHHGNRHGVFSAGVSRELDMAGTALKLLKETALGLPEQERAELARDLLLSLDGPADADVAEAWAAEIERRLEQVDSGAVELVEAEDVIQRIQQSLRRIQ